MTEQCCTTNNQVMILSCSGGSNVGQLSNQAAVELTRGGVGKMFCLVGIGAGLSGFVRSAKDVPAMILIDGCDVGCGKMALEREGVPIDKYLVITDLGIAKNKDFAMPSEHVSRVKQEVCRMCGLKTEISNQEDRAGSIESCCS